MMQALVLVIEASTDVGSVALIADDALVTQELVPSRTALGDRTEGILPAVARVLHAASAEPRGLTSVVCGGGPGGFTSLRSAAAIAKGMCSALHIPLYAVMTMELIIAGAHLSDGAYVAALGAGRDEYYASIMYLKGAQLDELTPLALVSRARLDEMARAAGASVVGPGFEIDVVPRAAAALPLLDRVFARGPVDLDAWEPLYGRLAEAQVKWEAQHGRPLEA